MHSTVYCNTVSVKTTGQATSSTGAVCNCTGGGLANCFDRYSIDSKVLMDKAVGIGCYKGVSSQNQWVRQVPQETPSEENQCNSWEGHEKSGVHWRDSPGRICNMCVTRSCPKDYLIHSKIWVGRLCRWWCFGSLKLWKRMLPERRPSQLGSGIGNRDEDGSRQRWKNVLVCRKGLNNLYWTQ